jgi:hypothetical protein
MFSTNFWDHFHLFSHRGNAFWSHSDQVNRTNNNKNKMQSFLLTIRNVFPRMNASFDHGWEGVKLEANFNNASSLFVVLAHNSICILFILLQIRRKPRPPGVPAHWLARGTGVG